MTIYKLSRNIDGYGMYCDKYFKQYEDAKKCINNHEALWFHDNTWNVERMKDCVWSEDQKEGSFYLRGIPFPTETEDDKFYNIQWCNVSITPIELEYEIDNDELFILKYNYEYNDWLSCSLDGINSVDYNNLKSPTIIGYYKSRKKARKIAARNKSLKKIARLWVGPEQKERISTLGKGENYLSIEKITLL